MSKVQFIEVLRRDNDRLELVNVDHIVSVVGGDILTTAVVDNSYTNQMYIIPTKSDYLDLKAILVGGRY